MHDIKIILSNESMRELYKLFSIMLHEEHERTPLEGFVLSELIVMFLDKSHKQAVKIKITGSQAYILYHLLSKDLGLPEGMKVILYDVCNQIQEQLFKRLKTDLSNFQD